MRRSVCLLAMVVSVGLACAKEKVSETSPAAIATTTYTVTVTFEGLVGFVNARAGNVVWAMLPRTDSRDPLPPGARESFTHYPKHYTVLKVNGMNVRDFEQPVDLLIPIDGYDITTSIPDGTGSSLTAADFVQTANASVDKIAESMLNTSLSSADQKLLAARMRLPNKDLQAHQGTVRFFNTTPQAPVGGVCLESATTSGGLATRVETVTWSPTLPIGTDLVLTLHPFGGGTDSTLKLKPAPGNFEIKIVNQVADALVNPSHRAMHWAAYRWYYNLSDTTVRAACNTHYYPKGPLGGDRCPMKLYWQEP